MEKLHVSPISLSEACVREADGSAPTRVRRQEFLFDMHLSSCHLIHIQNNSISAS